MASLLRNRFVTPVTLPYPYNGVVLGYGAVILPGAPSAVIARLGSQGAAAFEVIEVPDSDLLVGPTNGSYTAPSSAKVLRFAGIAAKSANSAHANYRGDAANVWTGTFTSPAYPRNLRMVFGANWDGGNVTVSGTNASDVAQTETFTGTASSTQVGLKIFKTVTGATKATVGSDTDPANVASIGTGDTLWAGTDLVDAFGMLTANGTSEAVTVSATNDSFIPTTVPNGSITYLLLVNLVQPIA